MTKCYQWGSSTTMTSKTKKLENWRNKKWPSIILHFHPDLIHGGLISVNSIPDSKELPRIFLHFKLAYNMNHIIWKNNIISYFKTLIAQLSTEAAVGEQDWDLVKVTPHLVMIMKRIITLTEIKVCGLVLHDLNPIFCSYPSRAKNPIHVFFVIFTTGIFSGFL